MISIWYIIQMGLHQPYGEDTLAIHSIPRDTLGLKQSPYKSTTNRLPLDADESLAGKTPAYFKKYRDAPQRGKKLRLVSTFRL